MANSRFVNLLGSVGIAAAHPRRALDRMVRGHPMRDMVLIDRLRAEGWLSGVTHIIDGGAHVGSFSRTCAHLLPECRVLAFEPSPQTFQRLLENTRMCPRIRALQCGLGPGRAKAQLNVSGLDQANSLLPMTAEHKKGWAGSDTVGTVEVEIISIDEALAGEESHGDLFVKLDVQGYELEALKGAQRSMPRVAALLVEASLTQLYEGAPSFAQLWEFIEGHGLRCWAIPDLIYAPGGELPMQANVVFVRPRSGGRRS